MTPLLFCFLFSALTLICGFVFRYCTPIYLLWYLKIRLKGRRLFVPPLGKTQKKYPEKRLVVSLTTIPSRIEHICSCINSILLQSRPADKIYIHIPDFSFRENRAYEVPAVIQADPRIHIHHCKTDEGPILKLSAALICETDPDTLILTVDDDTVYPRHLIETLLDHNGDFPRSALGFRGWHLPRSEKFLKRHILYGNSVTSPTRVDVLSGVCGILYPRHLFEPDFFDRSHLPEEAYFVDDICISGYLHCHGKQKILLPFPMREPFAAYINTQKSNPLWKINQDGRNDQKIMDYYFYHLRKENG